MALEAIQFPADDDVTEVKINLDNDTHPPDCAYIIKRPLKQNVEIE